MSMTIKQQEVFSLLAENRTSKEIGFRLQISESAVVKRLEVIRARTGFPGRAELVRQYRLYLQACEGDLVDRLPADVAAPRDTITATESHLDDCFVPAPLCGTDAALSRMAAMVVIAAGLLVIAFASVMTAHLLGDF